MNLLKAMHDEPTFCSKGDKQKFNPKHKQNSSQWGGGGGEQFKGGTHENDADL